MAKAKKKPAPARKKPAPKKPAKRVAPAKKRPRVVKKPAPLAKAIALLKAGDFAGAAEAFLHAAAHDPADWRLPNEAGVCYFRAHRYDDAIVCYDRAMMAMPDRAIVLTNRGLALLFATRQQEALENFKLALEADPTYPPAHFEIGKIHQDRARYREALAAYDATLHHNADVSRLPDRRLASLALLNKARILLGPMDDPDEGITQLHLLWGVYEDADGVIRLAKELAETNRALALRVLDVLPPKHRAARAARTALTATSSPRRR